MIQVNQEKILKNLLEDIQEALLPTLFLCNFFFHEKYFF